MTQSLPTLPAARVDSAIGKAFEAGARWETPDRMIREFRRVGTDRWRAYHAPVQRAGRDYAARAEALKAALYELMRMIGNMKE